MSLQNVGFYIEKLYQINKELGGKAKQGREIIFPFSKNKKK